MKDNQQELFVVVDQDDNIIGHRTRYECHHDKSLIHRAVSVALFNNNGEILLQKRSSQKDTYPGYFTLSASGHVGKGEIYLSSALRETKEELGIGNIELEYVGKQLVEMDNESEIAAVFKGICNGPFHVAHDEVDSVEFYPVNALKDIQNITPCALADLKVLNIF